MNKSKKPLQERLADRISEYRKYFADWEHTIALCDAGVAMATANALNGIIEEFEDFAKNLDNQANQLAKGVKVVGKTNDFKKLPIAPAARRAMKAAKQARLEAAHAESLLTKYVAHATSVTV